MASIYAQALGLTDFHVFLFTTFWAYCFLVKIYEQLYTKEMHIGIINPVDEGIFTLVIIFIVLGIFGA